MSTNQLTQASRRSLALTLKDGLWDILLGSFFVLLAIQEPLEKQGLKIWVSYLPAILTMGLGLPIYYMLKRKFVVPRMGLVKISLRKNKARRWLLGLAVALQIVTLIIFILAFRGTLGNFVSAGFSWTIDAFFSVAIFGFFAFMAYTMSTSRFYVYGILLGSSPLLGLLLNTDEVVSHIPTFVAGLAMVLLGIATFRAFMKNYPLAEQEEVNG
ncbi:MAG TPA: hypothetical protein VJ965_00040 [Anaerolineales bacterium]|nr:hypothetical protein [Anaerolineales bacterium]